MRPNHHIIALEIIFVLNYNLELILQWRFYETFIYI